MLVKPGGHIVWQYGQAGVPACRPQPTQHPGTNDLAPDGHVLITDQGNSRVIEVNLDHEIVWQYGTPGTPARAPTSSTTPTAPSC